MDSYFASFSSVCALLIELLLPDFYTARVAKSRFWPFIVTIKNKNIIREQFTTLPSIFDATTDVGQS